MNDLVQQALEFTRKVSDDVYKDTGNAMSQFSFRDMATKKFADLLMQHLVRVSIPLGTTIDEDDDWNPLALANTIKAAIESGDTSQVQDEMEDLVYHIEKLTSGCKALISSIRTGQDQLRNLDHFTG